MNDYYVYMYLTPQNVPFYIGRGREHRYKIKKHLSHQSEFLKRKILKIGIDNIRVYFLHQDVTLGESCFWERYWIQYIGRRNIHKGSLCNLSNGGEGNQGYKTSEETKELLRKANIGKKHTEETKFKMRISNTRHFLGKHHTEETKKKMREKHCHCWLGRHHTEETKQKMSESIKIALAKRKNSNA
jgi:hypothetical protein